jgi:uncharacterized membrane protein
MKTTFILAATAGIISASVAVAHTDTTKDTEKCYGIAKAGTNDCATATHACAGVSKMDNEASEYKIVAKGTCAGLKGSLTPPDSKKAN